MKVLFVVSEIILSVPMGVMQLSAVCKKHGHVTSLLSLRQQGLTSTLKAFSPDVIAYCAMTPDIDLFMKADRLIGDWISNEGRKVLRIMGGPHPTYFPQILKQCGLDAICVGEGDNAIVSFLDRASRGEGFSGIPNIMLPGQDELENKELIPDLDDLPFSDCDIIYDAAPQYRNMGLRSVYTSKGCPYKCTYCFNHKFNKIFQGCGKIMRRKSVDYVINELKHIVENYQPVTYIRFMDDTFAHRVDPWLQEFVVRYKKDIGLPFYCLMRSNTFTEEMAGLLAQAGCRSISMSIESGNEEVRNKILGRNLSDDQVRESFRVARKYGINTQANTMLGIPGTTLEDDFDSFRFSRSLRPTVPTFSIFCPYPGTDLTNYAIEQGFFDGNYNGTFNYLSRSVLSSLTEDEKKILERLCLLAPIFCRLPESFEPLMMALLRAGLNPVYSLAGSLDYISGYTFKIFPGILPTSPKAFIKVAVDSLKFRLSNSGKLD